MMVYITVIDLRPSEVLVNNSIVRFDNICVLYETVSR